MRMCSSISLSGVSFGSAVMKAAEGQKPTVIIMDRLTVYRQSTYKARADDYCCWGGLPDWEVPNMLAKYYATTTALAQAETSPFTCPN